MAAADPLRVSIRSDAERKRSANLARHRVAFGIREGDIAMDKVLSTRHSIANACTAPACSCTYGWKHLCRAGRQKASVLKGRGSLERDDY